MVTKIGDLYLQIRRVLSQQEDLERAGMIARNLLCHVTGIRPEQFLAQRDMYAKEEDIKTLDAALQRILAGEPLAYVLGQWDFYGLTLFVDKNVLIPRDDTCAVTELAIKTSLFLNASPRILDLCTGSGCIGLAVATRVKDARITLADISGDALNVAKKNVKAHKLTSRVACMQVDALQPPPAVLGKFDLIVSNPPYITEEEMKGLDNSVKDFEPHLALCGGTDGLDFYRAIAQNFKAALKPKGYLCFEFGMGQGDAVCRILAENGYTILERTRDYNDIERAVLAQYSGKDD